MGLRLLSPIAKIPFGKYKDTVLWMAPVSWFRWASEQQPDEETIDTLADALRMKEEEGKYAVLHKDNKTKFLYKLKSIHNMREWAEARCGPGDYVYAIVKPVNDESTYKRQA